MKIHRYYKSIQDSQNGADSEEFWRKFMTLGGWIKTHAKIQY